MATKRLTRKLTDVIGEVKLQLKAHYNVTDKNIEAWQQQIKHSIYPKNYLEAIDNLWIDYEVQRDVVHKHVINIMKNWDARVCSPASACQHTGDPKIYLYDAQHRTIAAGILGYTEIPCAIVDTDDKNFASYAFELLNDTGVKRLTPGDLHRNALVRFKNGSRDLKVIRARNMQDQFDKNGIDLQDKNSRNSDNLCGDNDYFFSHFKYAQKGIELDEQGLALCKILEAIKEVYPLQEEIDQGVFIGLYELQRLIGNTPTLKQPKDWMKTLLKSVKQSFNNSQLVHKKSKLQWEYSHPGAGWNAPLAMSNFLREVHIYNGGKLNLPYHGEGSQVGIEKGFTIEGLFPQTGE